MLNKEAFVNLIVGLCELYNKQPSEFIYDVYYEAFKDYTEEQVKYAISESLKVRKYSTFPKPADILEFLEGTREDKALMAWLRVREAIQKGGYYASIEFADEVIPYCIKELGGWQWLCSQLIKEMPFVEKRFKDLYRLFLKRGVEENMRVVGFIEASNNQKGHLEHIPEPIKIGHMEKKDNERLT